MSTIKMLEGAVRTQEGVEFKGILMHPIIEKCMGCTHVRMFDNEDFCSTYPMPERKWADGRCNFATNVKIEVSSAAKVNPLKASKRAAKGR